MAFVRAIAAAEIPVGAIREVDVEGKIVTCPWHGWQYDVTTGKVLQNPTVGVACYAVEVRDGEVFVDLG